MSLRFRNPSEKSLLADTKPKGSTTRTIPVESTWYGCILAAIAIFGGIAISALVLGAIALNHTQQPIRVNATCTSNNDCVDFTQACSISFCNSNHRCQIAKAPGAGCQTNADCTTTGSFCNLTSCQCENKCGSTSCVSTYCKQETCDYTTGTCIVGNIIPGCCDDNSECIDTSGLQCITSYCGANHTCIAGIPFGGNCKSNSDCNGLSCDSTTCTCVDLCAGVTCNNTVCERSACDPLTGTCSVQSIDDNCCVDASNCTTINSCYTPVCSMNRCSNIRPPGVCGDNSQCPGGSFCVNCTCTPQPNPPCITANDCIDASVCTLDVCAPGGCDHIPLPNCCQTDLDCNDSNNCTIDSCNVTTGTCFFKQKDEDGDTWLCGNDCDDNNASITGPVIWFRDADQDGQGDPLVGLTSCVAPTGFVISATDCNDNDANIFQTALSCNVGMEIPMTGPFGGINCGYSVGVYLNTLVMGCPNLNTSDPANFQSSTFGVFRRSYNGFQWIPITQESLSLSTNRSQSFASEIAIWDDIIVVGVPNPDDGTGIGYIRIYLYNPSLLAVLLIQEIQAPPDAVPGALFGSSIDIYNRTIVVGAYLDSPISGTQAGGAYVFVESMPLFWTLQQRLVPSSGGNFAWFGHSVAIYGNMVVVGAPSAGDTELTRVNYTAIYVFQSSLGMWNEVFNFIIPDTGTNNTSSAGLGFAVDINDLFIVATRLRRPSNSGGLNMFTIPGFVSLIGVDQFDRQGGDGFGYSASLADHILLVGAPFTQANSLSIGSTFLFTLSEYQYTNRFLGAGQRIYPLDYPTENISFGWDVSTSYGNLISGAPNRASSGGISYASQCLVSFVCPP